MTHGMRSFHRLTARRRPISMNSSPPLRAGMPRQAWGWLACFQSPGVRRLSQACVLLAVLLLGVGRGPATTNINLLGYTANGTLPAAMPSQSSNQMDVRAQLQAAVEAVGADPQGGTITIPGDAQRYWYCGGPVFVDHSNITIQGSLCMAEQPGSTVLVPTSTCPGVDSCPPFILGTPCQVSGDEITASHRVLLDSILDGSITGRYGLRTKGTNQAGTGTVYAHGYFEGSEMAVGPTNNLGWPSSYTRWQCPVYQVYAYDTATGKYDIPTQVPYPQGYQFTLDLALINNAGGTLTGTVCGVGQSNTITDRFTHWMVATDPNDSNKLKFWFKLDNGTVETIDITNAAITDANLHRITVQLDLGSTAGPGQTVNYPQGAAWFDGTQTQLITLPNKLGSWAPANYSSTNGGTEDTPYVFQITGNQLWKYEQAPFQLGSMGNGALGTVTSSGVSWTQQHVDWTFCGLAESKLCRYTWGATLTRADRRHHQR